jgi:AraC-like DNA-binding protein
LGILDLANIAQVGWRRLRYRLGVGPSSKLRRSTRALYAGHGIVLGRIEHEQRLFRGMRDNHAFVVPERGTWEFLYRGATYQQQPGLLQLKQPGELIRELRRDGAANYEIVVFDPAPLVGARAASSAAAELVFAVPQLAASDPRARALLTLRDLAKHADANELDPLALETAVVEAALVLVSLCGPQREAGHEGRAVQRAKTYLHERLSERIVLDDLADYVRLDKYHLIRSFRAQVGVPPYEYLTHARVHRARALLRAGAAASAAAITVGFYDQSQLHRHFVRLVGMTPGRYAASARSARTSIALGVDPQAASRGAPRP